MVENIAEYSINKLIKRYIEVLTYLSSHQKIPKADFEKNVREKLEEVFKLSKKLPQGSTSVYVQAKLMFILFLQQKVTALLEKESERLKTAWQTYNSL
ncbi:MAG: hypothetical protein D6767_05995 [Candidatus Hydrogenedentota bacterium]|nr:MAG: hypothetical protein D6767_05995 [Candidatus Hydrogenedentota bacterium]